MPKLITYPLAESITSAMSLLAILPTGVDDEFETLRLPETMLRDYITEFAGSDGREVELRQGATALEWRYVGDPDWTQLILLVDLKGEDGDDGLSVEMRSNGTYLQWRNVGAATWINLVSLAELKGDKGDTGVGLNPRGPWISDVYQPGDYVTHNQSMWFLIDDTAYSSINPPEEDLDHWMQMEVPAGVDGREVVLRKSGTNIEWQYSGASNWTTLVPLADITGADGKSVELQKTSIAIQWRQVGGVWANLVLLSEITGAAGKTIISVTGTPSNSLGTDGDYAIWSAGSMLYGPKASGAWPTGVSLQGVAGTAGSRWYSGGGPPNDASGAVNDYFLNTLNGDVYGPKLSTGWGSATGNIKGPATTYSPIPTVASAGNMDWWSLKVPVIKISGTTAVSYCGYGSDGQTITVIFTTALQFYTSNVLEFPGSPAVFTTAAGDSADFVFDASTGSTKCLSYTRAARLVDQDNDIPLGGTVGQILTKNSNVARDAGWADFPARLNALANLVGVANSVLMFSGATSLTQILTGAMGRSLMAATDAVASRSLIACAREFTNVGQDSTSNLDTLNSAGLYTPLVGTTNANIPEAALFRLFNMVHTNGSWTQILYPYGVSNSGNIWYRSFYVGNSNPSAWRRVVSTADVVTANSDATAGRLLSVGYHGLGASSLLTSSVDLVKTSGFFGYSSTNIIGNAISFANTLEIRWGSDSSWMSQLAMGISSNEVFYRSVNTNSANNTPWARMITSRNMSLAVSSDVNISGGIMEYGANASGEYWKFSNGLLICRVSFVGYTASTAKSASWPATFLTDTVPAISCSVTPSGYWDTSYAYYGTDTLAWFYSTGATTSSNTVNLIGFGRWK